MNHNITNSSDNQALSPDTLLSDISTAEAQSRIVRVHEKGIIRINLLSNHLYSAATISQCRLKIIDMMHLPEDTIIQHGVGYIVIFV